MSIFTTSSTGAPAKPRGLSLRSTLTAGRDSRTRRASHRSAVTRDSQAAIWFRRAVLRRKPVLFRVEAHLTDHCNLDCRGCGHFSNLCSPAFADLAEFESDMNHLANIFSTVREIRLIGGEPLLHPQVGEFCRAARAAFPKSRIYLKTNGTMVIRMKDEFWTALAETKTILLVESFPIQLPATEIDLLGKSHGVKVEWTDPRQEYVKIPIDPSGGHDAAASYKACRGYNNTPLLRHGRLYPCAYVAFADVFRGHFGLGGLEVYPTDWIGIRDEPDPEQVFAFLRNPVHWCSNCDMSNRATYDWGRSAHHVSEWTNAPAPARPAAAPAPAPQPETEPAPVPQAAPAPAPQAEPEPEPERAPASAPAAAGAPEPAPAPEPEPEPEPAPANAPAAARDEVGAGVAAFGGDRRSVSF